MNRKYQNKKSLLDFLDSHRRQEILGYGVIYEPLKRHPLNSKRRVSRRAIAVLVACGTIVTAILWFGALMGQP